MRTFDNLFTALLTVFWLMVTARGVFKEFKSQQANKWSMVLMWLLVGVGGAGFFAPMLCAEGLLKLPTSFEWPAGYVSGVAPTDDGRYVVPIVPAARVQIYDSHWKFMRGWNVETGGGDFKVQFAPDGMIEVFTARGAMHYSFDQNGHWLSSEGMAQPFSWLPNGQSFWVPTPIWLWVFSSPFVAWLIMAIGMAGLAIGERFRRRKNQHELNKVLA
jgi:hypothetical protein